VNDKFEEKDGIAKDGYGYHSSLAIYIYKYEYMQYFEELALDLTQYKWMIWS
jgi:hypothetical protein